MSLNAHGTNKKTRKDTQNECCCGCCRHNVCETNKKNAREFESNKRSKLTCNVIC